MTLPLPDPRVDQQPWELERQGVQRNFETVAQAFPLECSTAIYRQAPQARVYNSANISVANGGSGTVLTFDSERWDLGTSTEQHSTSANTSRLTCQVAGLYNIVGHAQFASNATGLRQAMLIVNGATYIAIVKYPAVNGEVHEVMVSTQYRLAVGDYVEFQVRQTSGGALNVLTSGNYSPEFAWHWVSP